MIKVIDHSIEHFLKIQPFKKEGIFIKKRGDRYLLVGDLKHYAEKLVKKGYKFDLDLKAWLIRPRKKNEYIYQVIGSDLGMPVDMRKYAHLIGTQRKRMVRPLKRNRSVELSYLSELDALLNKLHITVKERVLPILKDNQGKSNPDCLKQVNQVFSDIKATYNFNAMAKNIAMKILQKADRTHKERFIKQVNEATGINISAAI